MERVTRRSGTATFGTVKRVRRLPDGSLRFETENGTAELAAVGRGVFRIRMYAAGTEPAYRSYAVERRSDAAGAVDAVGTAGPELSCCEEDGFVICETEDGSLRVRRDAFAVDLLDRSGRTVSEGCEAYLSEAGIGERRNAAPREDYFGLGERPTPWGRRGYVFENWNTDCDFYHTEFSPTLYCSFPFFIAVTPGEPGAWGYFLDTSYRSRFDMGYSDWNGLDIHTDGEEFVLYLLLGDRPSDVLAAYMRLTGKPLLPPLWALGYHQCRYSYMSAAEAEEVGRTFRRRAIPCDAVWYDIDYMDAYRVFTFDPVRFPDMRGHVGRMKEMGFRSVVIVDPGVKYDEPGTYPALDDGTAKGVFIRDAAGEDFVGTVWPGPVKFPDFSRPEVREWWADRHAVYAEAGIDGFWNDMNEPALLDERKTLPEELRMWDDGAWSAQDRMHNAYALLECEATLAGIRRHMKGKRPFILSRSGSPGIQRYAAIWTGDNYSTWEHLRASVPQLLHLGLSGVGFCGVDVGGFSGNVSPELLVRWYQAAAFMPFFRNHSRKDATRQEPWVFGEPYESCCRRAIELRYRFLPYLYQVFREMHAEGTPVMRPLFWHDGSEEAFGVSTQFFVGAQLMAAPVLERGARERLVRFPEGGWYDARTLERFDGGRSVVRSAPLDALPLFVREGAVLPVARPLQSTAEYSGDTLVLEVYPFSDGPVAGSGGEEGYTAELYEDDGSTEAYRGGAFRFNRVRLSRENVLSLAFAEESVVRSVAVRYPVCGRSGPVWREKELGRPSGRTVISCEIPTPSP